MTHPISRFSGRRLTAVEFQEAAEWYMEAYGLGGWTFEWNNALHRMGLCDHLNQRLTFSKVAFDGAEWLPCHETITHEVAHAVVGLQHHHDEVWRRKFIDIGGSGEMTLKYTDDARLGAGYKDAVKRRHAFVGRCPHCGREIVRTRRDRLSCGRCSREYDSSAAFVWFRKDGAGNLSPAPLPPL